MSWSPTLQLATLLVAAGVAVWVAVVARSRRNVPGSLAFAWLMFATAYWAIFAALHTTADADGVRIAVATLQHVSISAIAPLWLLFASQYTRAPWVKDRAITAWLWAVPVVSVLMAFTNGWHGLLWAEFARIETASGSRLLYVHGPWFWIALAFHYSAAAAGTFVMVRAIRRYPPPHRRQTLAVVAGTLLPWLAHFLYVLEWLPPGADVTPAAIAVSGTALLWGFYRHRLLGLVPIARDLVIDSMDDAIVVLDQQRHIVDFNPAAMQLAALSQDNLGRSIEDAAPWWTFAFTDGTETGLPAVIAVHGRFLEIEVKPVRDGRAHFAGWLVLARDISARRKAERDRRDLERRVLEQQKVESLTVLAGGVAHDFNNLLTGILGNADLLSMAVTGDPTLRKHADAIVIGAQRAADLVAKMLAYAGEGQTIAELVDFDELVREMVELMRASAARHCRVEYHGEGPLPPIKVDATQVRQVVLNLIVNASEAVEDGGVVKVSAGTASLDGAALAQITLPGDAQPGLFVFIRVKDTGAGMDRTTIPRIFEPFFSTKQEGHGLGLAAVQGIVRGHHGALHVETAPGHGTTFTVWFPLDPPITTALRA